MRGFGQFDGLQVGAEELVLGALVGVLHQEPLVRLPGARVPHPRQRTLAALPQNKPGENYRKMVLDTFSLSNRP